MTSNGLQPQKPHHSSLFSIFGRKKRQTSAPVAPEPAFQKEDESHKKSKPPVPSKPKHKPKKESNQMKVSQSQNLHNKKSGRRKETLSKGKAFSSDAINELDPEYLTEALLAIGDEQPMVARSTPKHAVLRNIEHKTEQRQRQNCLFEPQVYEKMLSDSLRVCDLLTNHLDECISVVRTKSPVMEKRVLNTPIPGFNSLPRPGSPLPANSGPFPLVQSREHISAVR